MKNINEIISALPPEDRARISARAEQLIGQEMALQHLRKARCLTQESMANMLGIGQESVSKLESRSDLLLSTLRSYVEAMGGSLCLVAKFPDGIATLSAFGQVDEATCEKHSERKAISRAVRGRKNIALAHAND
jgi:transcriptional regulator with XRE-family HTH domain